MMSIRNRQRLKNKIDKYMKQKLDEAILNPGEQAEQESEKQRSSVEITLDKFREYLEAYKKESQEKGMGAILTQPYFQTFSDALAKSEDFDYCDEQTFKNIYSKISEIFPFSGSGQFDAEHHYLSRIIGLTYLGNGIEDKSQREHFQNLWAKDYSGERDEGEYIRGVVKKISDSDKEKLKQRWHNFQKLFAWLSERDDRETKALIEEVKQSHSFEEPKTLEAAMKQIKILNDEIIPKQSLPRFGDYMANGLEAITKDIFSSNLDGSENYMMRRNKEYLI